MALLVHLKLTTLLLRPKMSIVLQLEILTKASPKHLEVLHHLLIVDWILLLIAGMGFDFWLWVSNGGYMFA